MGTKLDMHLHTSGSDGSGTPTEFVRAILAAGLDGIVVTDHHRTLTPEGLAVVKAVRAEGLIALVGCEYSTKEGHCLVYGVDVAKLDFGYWPSMQAVLDRVHEVGGVAFPSHPYRGNKETLGDGIYKLRDLTHAEAYNGQNEAGNGWASSAKPEANQKAVWAAEKMGLAQTGGSDAHQPSRIGTCFTEFGGKVRSVQDLVAALKSRDHQARVNAEMVAKQRKAAASFERNWITNAPKMPKWMEDEDRQLGPRLDMDSGRFYSGLDDEEEDASPSQCGFDFTGGGDLDSSSYIDVNDPAAVQAFLQHHGGGRKRGRRS